MEKTAGRLRFPRGSATIVVASLLMAVAALALAQTHGKGTVTAALLDAAREWLWNNPPNGKNRTPRREQMAVIQRACDQLAAGPYSEYARSSGDPARLASLEGQSDALYYLRKATDHAVEDIRKTRVQKGLAVWHVYNMGYVFKAPNACFGIDLHCVHADRLAADLDFLLITHEHGDHYSRELLDAMIRAKKPVVTRWYPGSTVLKGPGRFRFGSVRVKVDIGDHHYEQRARRTTC